MKTLLLTAFLLVTLCCGVSLAEYWGSSESSRYHYGRCWWRKTIKKEYLVRFASADEAFRAGYTPCGKCRPPVTDKRPVPNAANRKTP